MSQSDQVRPGGADYEVEALDTLSKMESKAAVPESVFVKEYLPLFAGESKNAEVDISKWLDVAGNAYRSVDVIKDNEVLFTVPPLLKRSPTNVKRRPQDSIYELVDLVQKKTAVHPQIGRSFMNSQLDARISRLSSDPSEVATWNDIFKRYGYEPINDQIVAETDNDGKVTASSSQSASDLFDDGHEEL